MLRGWGGEGGGCINFIFKALFNPDLSSIPIIFFVILSPSDQNPISPVTK